VLPQAGRVVGPYTDNHIATRVHVGDCYAPEKNLFLQSEIFRLRFAPLKMTWGAIE
jgi:hypothetical protein